MNVRPTHSTANNFDVYIVFLPFLWLELAPDHLPIDRGRIVPKPALEFVVCSHFKIIINEINDRKTNLLDEEKKKPIDVFLL